MNNESAFPVHGHNMGFPNTGMTLRDYFAAKAVQGYITAVRGSGDSINPQEIVDCAYFIADAMLEERKNNDK